MPALDLPRVWQNLCAEADIVRRSPHGRDEQCVILALGHDARADHVPKPQPAALASRAECSGSRRSPRCSRVSGTAPLPCRQYPTATAMPGERIVSRSRAEARARSATRRQARVWPKYLRQRGGSVCCVGGCDACESWNCAEDLTVRTERRVARPVRTTVKQLSRERHPRAETDAARRLTRLTRFLGREPRKRRDAVRLALI